MNRKETCNPSGKLNDKRIYVQVGLAQIGIKATCVKYGTMTLPMDLLRITLIKVLIMMVFI